MILNENLISEQKVCSKLYGTSHPSLESILFCSLSIAPCTAATKGRRTFAVDWGIQIHLAGSTKDDFGW